MKGSGFFILKVMGLSLLLSIGLKLGGPALPISPPYGAELNRWAIALVLLPTVVMAGVLLALLSRQRPSC